MVFLKFLIIALLILFTIAYLVQPALLTLPYTTFLNIFFKNPPYLSMKDHFPDHQLLKSHWEEIREELLEVLKNEQDVPKFHEVDSIQRFISARDDVSWRTFFIKAYGKWLDTNAAKVPRTTALLKQLPQVTTALFSILDGGKHIPPHIGFFKAVFRYHLGLIVPTDAPCYIIVGGKKYSWKEGEDVLFDDTYLHEVWNKSSGRRVVLFCDVYREAGLPGWIRALNRRMFNLLAKSKRLSKALKKAEVTHGIAASNT